MTRAEPVKQGDTRATGIPNYPLVPAGIVLYRPNPAVLDRLLSTLDLVPRRLLIFSNGPLDTATEARLAGLSNATVVRSAFNLGLGAALNRLLERADAERFSHLMLLDQDSEPDPHMPELLAERFGSLDCEPAPLAIVAPLLVVPAEGNYRRIRYSWRRRSRREIVFAPTSGSLISVAAWKRIGPFRADYFIDGIDVEWGLRAWARGYRSVLAEDVRLLHRWGEPASVSSRPQILRQSHLRNYYYIRNSIDRLRLPYTPVGWRIGHGVRLSGQITRLLLDRRLERHAVRLVRDAILAGLSGRLGPAPDEYC